MVADVIKNSIASDAAKTVVAQMFADRFYYDNSNFKQEIFFKRIFGPDFKERSYRYDEYTIGNRARSCPTCGGGMSLMDDRYTCVNCGATVGDYRPRTPMRREVRVRGHGRRVK
ncbi:MAG: hypothetical protein E6K18_08665 [Methanobacteriota archaeon]|nr:MAG: hypothetical protein E6K18_08665 [Euryarchaeota archaeon]